uniref:Uncharacterized protein n=1 Tax=Caenorhabditis japonica TaxID=281687 RepID=A0A8R1EJ98_CAEJA
MSGSGSNRNSGNYDQSDRSPPTKRHSMGPSDFPTEEQSEIQPEDEEDEDLTPRQQPLDTSNDSTPRKEQKDCSGDYWDFTLSESSPFNDCLSEEELLEKMCQMAIAPTALFEEGVEDAGAGPSTSGTQQQESDQTSTEQVEVNLDALLRKKPAKKPTDK